MEDSSMVPFIKAVDNPTDWYHTLVRESYEYPWEKHWR